MILAVLALAHQQTSLVETVEGDLPIILTAPHGGVLAIPGAIERTNKDAKQFVTVTDTRTDTLARTTAAEIEKLTGKKPWVIIAKFGRKYLDVNRPIETGAEGDAAKAVYKEYHNSVRNAVDSVRKKFGKGFFLDIHGQGQQSDIVFRGTQNLKTVKGLPEDQLSGQSSILGMLESQGIKIAPAMATSHEKENPKLDGGYTVQTYGSQHENGIFAIQLEFGGSYRKKEAIPDTASKLAKAIKSHLDAFFAE